MFTKVRISKCWLIVLVKCPKMKENWEKGKNQEPKTPTHHQWELRKFYAWPPPPVLVSFAWPSLILKVIRFSKCVNVCFCIVSLPQERMSVKSVSEEKSQNVLRTPVSISRDFLQSFFTRLEATGALLDGAHLENDVSIINMCTYSITSGLLLLLFRPPDPKIYTLLPAKREIKLESPKQCISLCGKRSCKVETPISIVSRL